MSYQFDAVIIGAGHNGLACAGYLAKNGLKVLVLERRGVVGGACATEELLPSVAPGFKYNVCASDHIFISLSPVVEDLQLRRFGLEYIDVDPMFFAPFPDGEHLFLYRDVEKTVKEIERLSPHDAKAYRRYVEHWNTVGDTLLPFLFAPPLPMQKIGGLLNEAEGEVFLQSVLPSVKQVVEENFETDYVKGLIAWFGVQAGAPPTELGTGFIAGLHAYMHRVGVKRPRGGSGMLPVAMAKAVEHFGGTVRTDAEVKRVVIENGGAMGVELADGRRITSRVVVSNADPKRTLLKLVGPEHLNDEFARKVEGIKVTAYKLKVDGALRELPEYAAYPVKGVGPHHRASQIISPSVQYLERAYYDALLNERLSREPAMWVAIHSASDPSLAPPGGHVLYLWAAYFTVEKPKNNSWEQLREEAAERALDALSEYAPNLRGAIVAKEAKSHFDLERMLALPKGNSMHVDPSLDQMFSFRPLPGCSNYRTPVKNLYLTGSGTHPFGGVSAIPGYNTAHAVLEDWGKH